MTDESLEPTVAAALARLERQDLDAAKAAAVSWTSLAAGTGLAGVTQLSVQEFCWYELPLEFMTSTAEKEFIAESLGRLLELLGLPRYAAICTSPATMRLLAAYEESPSAGRQAYTKALDASGVLPPDLPELRWSPGRTMLEDGAFDATAAALELAIAAGELRPGGRGWRRTQQDLALAFLTASRPELDGESWLARVTNERIAAWTTRGGPVRQALFGRLTKRLRAPRTVPENAGDSLDPLRTLLDLTADGLPLTQNGNIAQAVVRDLSSGFGWWEYSGRPRTEDDVMQLRELHELLRRMRAIRRSGRRLVLTTAGRTMRESVTALWDAVVSHLIPTGDFEEATAEAALGILLTTAAPLERQDLATRVQEIVADSGWHDPVGGTAPSMWDVYRALTTLYWLLETLGFVERHDDAAPWDAPLRLSPNGAAAALGALRHRATDPPP